MRPSSIGLIDGPRYERTDEEWNRANLRYLMSARSRIEKYLKNLNEMHYTLQKIANSASEVNRELSSECFSAQDKLKRLYKDMSEVRESILDVEQMKYKR